MRRLSGLSVWNKNISAKEFLKRNPKKKMKTKSILIDGDIPLKTQDGVAQKNSTFLALQVNKNENYRR